MRLSGSMLSCLCYVRLVRPVFIPRASAVSLYCTVLCHCTVQCCVTVQYSAVSLYCTVLCHCTVQCCVTVQYSAVSLYCTVTQHCTVQWHSTRNGGWTQAEPDGHNINKTACYQIISCTVCLSNFIPTLIYAPWGWSHRGIETRRRYFKSILNPF